MYAKAHPFGYKKVAAVRDDFKNFRQSKSKKHRQTVTIDCPYGVTERVAVRNPETGKLEFQPVYEGTGKNRKPKKTTFHNTITRHITHYQQ